MLLNLKTDFHFKLNDYWFNVCNTNLPQAVQSLAWFSRFTLKCQDVLWGLVHGIEGGAREQNGFKQNNYSVKNLLLKFLFSNDLARLPRVHFLQNPILTDVLE